MYRRHLGQDEQLSQVLIFFAMTLVFGFLISWKLVGEDTFDPEMIVYLVFGGIGFLLMVVSVVLFLIGNRRPFIDITIDIKKRQIRFFYSLFTYSFDDISLVSFNKRHRQVRIVIKWFTIGFPIEEMRTSKGVVFTEDQVTQLNEAAPIVEPKVLYNYPMVATAVFIGFFITYIVVYGKDYVPIFNWRYIETYYIIIIVVVLSVLSYAVNRWRLSRVFRKILEKEDTTNS